MKQIKVQPLTRDEFAPFGEFYDMANPDGYPLCGAIHKFYPDRMTTTCTGRLAFSPLVIRKPESMVITQQEYHTSTEELIFPVDDDMIIHVAEPSAGVPIPQHTKAFLVPKNTLVKMNACVWHLAPLPANCDELCAMIVLPECTYINDCIVIDLKEDEQFIIEK